MPSHFAPPPPAQELRQGETPASFFQEGIELPEHLVSRNALHLSGIDLVSPPLGLFEPCRFGTLIGRTIKLLEERSKNLLFLGQRKLTDLALNYGNWSSHAKTLAMASAGFEEA